MSGYELRITSSAAKSLMKLPRVEQKRIRTAVDALPADPRPHGVTKLSGTTDSYRIRVGNYRIVYTIDDGELIIVVVRIGHRKEVYNR
ncbi:type II toxin-antitoxin system RelE family toxin [Gordonia insulae]|uniref:Toxin RelG n=1 Tax=Gordonia insulae TaxID=2420509 RepID=A0A3G8JUK5_9ACTN|nr:type II toxin-antitoxin system RelE/ParE family toxin [Gordonia insulae]AZG48851.1 Toxin RelG [Gordonia insulae]